jgi:predicted unusual protein kinase regulating ubiquinone biosynthesis (AarF/ABC1/UbiB family)
MTQQLSRMDSSGSERDARAPVKPTGSSGSSPAQPAAGASQPADGTSPAASPQSARGGAINSSSSLPPFVDGTLARSEYNPALADETVRFPRLFFDRRFWQLGFIFLSFLCSAIAQTVFPDKKLGQEERLRRKAATVRQLLFDLGPTFIKLGQFLSARGDILPEAFAEELSLLQDRVPPFGLELVRQTIRQDLGGDPEMIFLDFDPKPIASASIGQVHRVRLKEGGWAVVKVQRPSLPQQFYRDLGLMRLMARWWVMCSRLGLKLGIEPPTAKNHNAQQTQLTRHRPLDVKAWMELSDEFGHTLFSEIDYLKEGKNADRLRRAVRSNTHIRVPRVHWRYTGRHVLTLEYIPGTKISQVDELRAKGFDLEQTGNMLVNCYLEQFVLTGFFHADPHAGNLAIDDYGRLIIYDFGMMGEISEPHRRALLQCVMAVVRRDAEHVTRALMELGIVSKNAPAEAVSRAISPFIDYYAGRDIMDLDFRHLEADIDQVVEERSFRLPANLAYLLRAGSSLEGIARTLKPDFSFVEAVRPVMTKWALQQGIESLAKSGKLLEFAEFAFTELRASLRTSQETGSENASDREVKKPLLARMKPAAKASSTGSKSQPPIIEKAPQPAKCAVCVQHNSDIKKLQRQLTAAKIWMTTWFLLSTGVILWSVYVASSSYRGLSLYFVIGFLVLGAIIFWKLTKLLKWTSHRSADLESRGNGD